MKKKYTVKYSDSVYSICSKNLIPECNKFMKNCKDCPFKVSITSDEKERICLEVAIIGDIHGDIYEQ